MTSSEEKISKSHRKREMLALQKLGEQLLSLDQSMLDKLELTSKLRDAIAEFKRLPNKNEAKRRQLQFIGRVMRESDVDASSIEQTLLLKNQNVEIQKRHHHRLENLRENLVLGDTLVLEQLINEHPELEIQHLRQLIRQAQKEVAAGKTQTAGRKLFRYLRDSLNEELK